MIRWITKGFHTNTILLIRSNPPLRGGGIIGQSAQRRKKLHRLASCFADQPKRTAATPHLCSLESMASLGSSDAAVLDFGAAPPSAEASRPMCNVCNATLRKYCCPRCSVLTCSLECCTRHKIESGCTGRRDRTAFKDISALSEQDLASDYTLLEAIELGVGRAKRSRVRDGMDGRQWGRAPKKAALRMSADDAGACSGLAGPGIEVQGPTLAPAQHRLVRAAASMGVTLLIMPQGMSRRLENTSCVDRGSHVSWRVEFNFGGHSLPLNRAAPTSTWRELLSEHLVGGTRHELRAHCDALDGKLPFRLVLKRELGVSNQQRFFNLNPDSTVMESLRGKTIIEFPTVHVVLEKDFGQFQLVIEDIAPAAAEASAPAPSGLRGD